MPLDRPCPTHPRHGFFTPCEPGPFQMFLHLILTLNWDIITIAGCFEVEKSMMEVDLYSLECSWHLDLLDSSETTT